MAPAPIVTMPALAPKRQGKIVSIPSFKAFKETTQFFDSTDPVEELATKKVATDKAATDKAATDKVATKKVATDKVAMKKVAAANRVAEEASVCVEPTVADPDPGLNTKMDISYKIDFAADDDDTNGVG